MKKIAKVLLIFIGVVAVLLVTAGIILKTVLDEPLKQALVEEFEKQTLHEYTLSLSDLSIGLLSRSVIVENVRIEAGEEIPHIREITADKLTMKGISLLSLISQDMPDFKTIVIERPDVELKERSFTASAISDGQTSEDSLDVSFDKFDLLIRNGQGRIIRDDDTELISVSGIELEASEVDLNILMQGTGLLFLNKLNITGENFKWRLPEKYYELTAGDFDFKKNEKTFEVSDLAFTPTLPKYDFSKAYGHQLDRIHLEIPHILLTGLQLDSLAKQHLDADSLFVDNAWLEVFRDKHLDRKTGNDPKPLLHEAARSIDFSFGLNGAGVKNTTIIYEEHKPPSDSSGNISFNKLNATLGPFHTATHPKFSEQPLQLDVSTQFMDAASLDVQIYYPYSQNDNTHVVEARLGATDPNIVSGMLKNVGFVRVESGKVDTLYAEYTLDNEKANGEVTVIYEDLEVSFMNKSDPDNQNLARKAGDFFTNNFVIKSDNKSDDPRTGTIDFEREKEKSIFAYWWKALLSGLKDSIK